MLWTAAHTGKFVNDPFGSRVRTVDPCLAVSRFAWGSLESLTRQNFEGAITLWRLSGLTWARDARYCERIWNRWRSMGPAKLTRATGSRENRVSSTGRANNPRTHADDPDAKGALLAIRVCINRASDGDFRRKLTHN